MAERQEKSVIPHLSSITQRIKSYRSQLSGLLLPGDPMSHMRVTTEDQIRQYRRLLEEKATQQPVVSPDVSNTVQTCQEMLGESFELLRSLGHVQMANPSSKDNIQVCDINSNVITNPTKYNEYGFRLIKDNDRYDLATCRAYSPKRILDDGSIEFALLYYRFSVAPRMVLFIRDLNYEDLGKNNIDRFEIHKGLLRWKGDIHDMPTIKEFLDIELTRVLDSVTPTVRKVKEDIKPSH
jgi:hypothetical protein